MRPHVDHTRCIGGTLRHGRLTTPRRTATFRAAYDMAKGTTSLLVKTVATCICWTLFAALCEGTSRTVHRSVNGIAQLRSFSFQWCRRIPSCRRCLQQPSSQTPVLGMPNPRKNRLPPSTGGVNYSLANFAHPNLLKSLRATGDLPLHRPNLWRLPLRLHCAALRSRHGAFQSLAL